MAICCPPSAAPGRCPSAGCTRCHRARAAGGRRGRQGRKAAGAAYVREAYAPARNWPVEISSRLRLSLRCIRRREVWAAVDVAVLPGRLATRQVALGRDLDLFWMAGLALELLQAGHVLVGGVIGVCPDRRRHELIDRLEQRRPFQQQERLLQPLDRLGGVLLDRVAG